MADESQQPVTGLPTFDDDRLLALALGLDDDPELIAAAAADEGLRRRLEAARADVEQAGRQVRAAVPAPPEDYADLSDPRWAGLQAYVAAPPPARTRRATRWLRVLAPAVVALVAVAIGLAVINDQRSGTLSVNSSLPTTAKAADEAAGPLSGGATDATGRDGDYALSLSKQLDSYALVVLAKAQAASGAFQRFLVVRILKGDGPDVVRLRVADRPADVGRLQVLFLRPGTEGSAEIGTETTSTVEPVPAQIPGTTETTGTLKALAVGAPVMFSYQGEMAMARELPAGTDPDTVELW
jgi:hypothetical protein